METEIEKETEIDGKPGGNGVRKGDGELTVSRVETEIEKETEIDSKPGGNGVRKGDGN